MYNKVFKDHLSDQKPWESKCADKRNMTVYELDYDCDMSSRTSNIAEYSCLFQSLVLGFLSYRKPLWSDVQQNVCTTPYVLHSCLYDLMEQ